MLPPISDFPLNNIIPNVSSSAGDEDCLSNSNLGPESALESVLIILKLLSLVEEENSPTVEVIPPVVVNPPPVANVNLVTCEPEVLLARVNVPPSATLSFQLSPLSSALSPSYLSLNIISFFF